MDKRVLLEAFKQLVGTTEYELGDNFFSFLQVDQYRDLQNPSKFLIVGGRGSGKTRIFRTLTGPEGFRRVIGENKPYQQPNYENTTLLVGFSADATYFPRQSVMSKYYTDAEATAFWIGSIAHILVSHYQDDPQIQATITECFGEKAQSFFASKDILKTPSQWIPLVVDNPEPWELFLDRINEILVQRDQWVILAYDQIDRIHSNQEILYSYIRTLVTYWYSVSQRWKRLKCKIFLRTDLRNAKTMRFPDASKLIARQIDLTWDTVSLYRLLIRRLSNMDDFPEMVGYLQQIPSLISANDNWGYIPTEQREPLEKFVEQLIGRYMGASPKKGYSYTWIPNHLQDANGDLSPRSFLKCYSCAATSMLAPQNQKSLQQLQGNALLTPSAIQDSIQEVSTDRVQELQEDFPWLEKFKTILEGSTLLMQEEEFLSKIQHLLEYYPSENFPAKTASAMEDELISLGIIQRTTDARINMPEIYLHGFGLKRKGGIRHVKS